MRALLAMLLLAASCTGTAKGVYPDCLQTGTTPICSDRSDVAHSAQLGILAWRDTYHNEWPADRIDFALIHTAIFFGPKARTECPPESSGCITDLASSTVARLYADTALCTKSGCAQVPPWFTALQHELTHMAEHWIDGVDDYEHDNKPYRWNGMLPTGARRLWCYQQTNKEECMELY